MNHPVRVVHLLKRIADADVPRPVIVLRLYRQQMVRNDTRHIVAGTKVRPSGVLSVHTGDEGCNHLALCRFQQVPSRIKDFFRVTPKFYESIAVNGLCALVVGVPLHLPVLQIDDAILTHQQVTFSYVHTQVRLEVAVAVRVANLAFPVLSEQHCADVLRGIARCLMVIPVSQLLKGIVTIGNIGHLPVLKVRFHCRRDIEPTRAFRWPERRDDKCFVNARWFPVQRRAAHGHPSL